jgi:hypothetical protein
MSKKKRQGESGATVFLLFHKSFSRRADFLPEIQIVLPVTCVSELMIKKLSRLTLNCAHQLGKRGLIA